jgi:hypothetical protein
MPANDDRRGWLVSRKLIIITYTGRFGSLLHHNHASFITKSGMNGSVVLA